MQILESQKRLFILSSWDTVLAEPEGICGVGEPLSETNCAAMENLLSELIRRAEKEKLRIELVCFCRLKVLK